MDLQHRKQWSKKHGQDVYGDSGDSDEEGVELKPEKQGEAGNSWRDVQGMWVHLSSAI